MLSEMHFSDEASRRLSQMKGRTGLTPNILARMGFCLSLEDPEPINVADFDGPPGHINIKWHVLVGSYEPLFVALLKERCKQDAISQQELVAHFKAHMNRGALLLAKQLKSLDRLVYLMPREVRAEGGSHGRTDLS